MIIIAPDKFKGSLSSNEICDIIESAIKDKLPDAIIVKFPFSDGGNGFLEVIHHYHPNLQIKQIQIENPLLTEKINTHYLSDGHKAFIENALSNGCQLINEDQRNPIFTSTFGLGQIVENAINEGHKEIFIGLGGSSTNDGGIGFAAALGYNFSNNNKDLVKPMGKNLTEITDYSFNNCLDDISFYGIYDVENFFSGEYGASNIYAKQKGASPSDIIHLETGMNRLSALIKNKKGIDLNAIKGSGAAGGLGGGLFAFFNAVLIKGTDFFIKLSNIKDYLKNCDLLITGEGSLDEQSLYGKVVFELSAICKNYQIPVFAVSGINSLDISTLKKLGISKVYQLKSDKVSLDQSINNAKNILNVEAQKIAEEIFMHYSVI